MSAEIPEDSIAYADIKLRESLDFADYWAQQAIERRGNAEGAAYARLDLAILRARLPELVILARVAAGETP